ncbi:MAG: ribonuclease HII [Brevinematales bacterium]|jgi:ribonuclease HII
MKVPPVRFIIDTEKDLWQSGYRNIAGMDEAGRGPLAGPVVSACVVFDPFVLIEGVFDSKSLLPSKRKDLYKIIVEKCRCFGIGIIDNITIDRVNILEATKLSMHEALQRLSIRPDYVLIDAVRLQLDTPVKPIIKGDCKSFTIAAASIIAKVSRDSIMERLHEEYPMYGWDRNKGYGTEEHRKAIEKYGPSKYHRRSFKFKPA